MIDAPCNRAREAGCGGMPEPETIGNWIVERFDIRRQRKNQVAVHWSMCGHQGAGHAVVGSGSHASTLCLR